MPNVDVTSAGSGARNTYLAANPVHPVTIGRERLRQILERHRVTFQRTKT